MSRTYPALDITLRRADPETTDLILAVVDDDRPFAVEDTGDALRVFFGTDAARASAAARLTTSGLSVSVESVDVPDDDWAVKGQPALQPVQVGRLVIVPEEKKTSGMFFGSKKHTRRLFVPPSMGFGTGHHASTRLCLTMLQELPLDGRRVLDVGTGSGILAIAACVLGAAAALGIDCDEDALGAARENVQRNGVEPYVSLRSFDLDRDSPATLGTFDVVLANLTGGHLEQRAAQVAGFVAPGGHLIASGFQVREAADVASALAGAHLSSAALEEEEGWAALLLTRSRLKTENPG